MNLLTMNKKILFSALFIACQFLVAAQVSPTRRTGSTYHTNNDTTSLGDIREKLVQLALQNPNFEIVDRKVSVAGFNLTKARGEWLSVIVPSINLNPLTIKPKSEAQFLPLWNVAVAIPLNFYTSRKNDIRIARENIYIAEAEKNERYREIRANVLTRYEDYLMYKEMMDLQTRVTQDAFLFYRQRENDFADDAIGIDDYNKAFAQYKEQQDRLLQARRNFNVSKIDLEQMIGISIDEVLRK